MNKKVLSMNVSGVVLVTFLFASSVICGPTQIHDLLRSRREALAEPEPSAGSAHADHDVKCDDGDNSELMKSCPNNDTCPMDEMTIEKCCHCLGVCCQAGSSDGMSMKNGTEEGSAEPEPGKGFGSKVKDAFSSAEGWLKNQGHNIKSSLDKAADNVKQYASDVKDKVQDGIKSITGKGKNDTKSGSDCMSKDGKCSTDMTTDSGRTEDSSSEDSTPVPGMQKSKREASADMDSSSTTENTPSSKRNKRGGPAWNMSTESPSNTSKPPERRRRASGNDDSTSTTETSSSTGKRDKRASGSDMMSTTDSSMTTKREKRAAGVEMSTETSTTSSGRDKRAAGSDMMTTTDSSMTGKREKRAAGVEMSTETSTSSSGRDKRASGSDMMTTTDSSMTSKREKRAAGSDMMSTTDSSMTSKREKRAAETDMMSTTDSSMTSKREKRAAEVEMSTETSTSSSGRDKRETGMDQMPTTETSSSTRRTKRASGSEMSTESSSDPTSTSKGSGGRSRREAMKMREMSTMSPDATSASSGSSADPEDVAATGEPPSAKSPGFNNPFVGASIRVVSSWTNGTLRENSGRPSGTMFFPSQSHSPPPDRRGMLVSNSDNDDGIIMGKLSISVYSGNESLPTISRSKDAFGNGGNGSLQTMAGLDLAYRPPTTTSIRSGAIVISDQSPQDTSKTRIIGLDLDGLKPGNCQPLSLGVTCSPLQPDAIQCSVDSDCLGTKKCCFYSCHPHEDVGICEHPVSTPV